jgi:SAM-dependent methyltransferase
LPCRVLDSGCGIGVIGICAARALQEAAGNGGAAGLQVRAQDRDELARILSHWNALRNGLGDAVFQARTEPLLAGEETWDLILSNVPAKAGEPVLEDFISRSALSLRPGGRAIIVVVNTLAPFFQDQLKGLASAGLASGPTLVREGTEHQVLVYGGPAVPAARHSGAPPPDPAPGLPGSPACAPRPPLWRSRPFYLRNRAAYEMEGISYGISAVYGAAEFDRPGAEVESAAALLVRLGPRLFGKAGPPFLIHEGGQGHFPLWLLLFLERKGLAVPETLLLHGRNILALEAARGNIIESALTVKPALLVTPGVGLDRESPAALMGPIAPGAGFIAAFPRILARTEPYAALWEALRTLLLPGAVALFSLPATQADRLDRRKPGGFTRLGDLKRHGFRALAYRGA